MTSFPVRCPEDGRLEIFVKVSDGVWACPRLGCHGVIAVTKAKKNPVGQENVD